MYMENAMLNNEELWDEDTEIDPELWLQALLAMTADKAKKEQLVQGISRKTGLPLVNIITQALLWAALNPSSDIIL
jgi:hypothetical protein